MIRRSVVALAITLALAASACSSGSDDATPATTHTNPPTAISTTDAPTTTPTNPPTTATTSTTIAPTTLDPTAQIEAAVKQAVLDREDAFFAAASDPTDSDAREVYRATHAPGKFAERAAFLDGLLANGTTVRSSTEVEKSITFPSPVELLSDSSVAIEVCLVDSDIIRIPPTETTPEVIVDDRVVTTLARSEYVLIDGTWVLDGGEVIQRWQEASVCEI